MKLHGIRIRNYRTIAAEQYVDLRNGLSLVGPNNAGKTNILTAIRMLFTGYENSHGYSREHDLTFNERSAQTSLVGVFWGDRTGADKEVYDQLDELKSLLGLDGNQEASAGDEIHLYLTFSTSSNPSYRFFPNTRRPTEAAQKTAYSRRERDLVQKILGCFVCHYVPSNKSFEQIYEDLLTPFLKRHVALSLSDKIDAINQSLSSAARSLTTALQESGLRNLEVRFGMPKNELTQLLSGFEFRLLDPNETTVFKKGVGIQSTTILSSFDWITEREVSSGLEVIWLIEEPEAFLHPTLNEICKKLLQRLRSRSLVVITTHSLSFVPQDPNLTGGVGLLGDTTIINKFKTYRESTEAIRRSIGVKFSDFFNFGVYNVLLEGPSDREYLEWILQTIPQSNDHAWALLRSTDCHFLDYGGVTFLAGFLRATWEFMRDETIAVTVFDGDIAGERARKELQGYFGNKNIPFQPNEDFVSVRKGFPIEALFPDVWLEQCYAEHPSWFQDFSVDASGALESFELRDSSKKQFAAYAKQLVTTETTLDWAARWIDVCKAIDLALTRRQSRIQSLNSIGQVRAEDLLGEDE